ncbi:PREDICTED: probable protein phosphatase 2C 68 [Tarenaya hassleriana]|uniref:probable protein phosphatase 2C 68 n=1 Tax=Tarenaya hassleriana TaxID=28532 RepID=UPI00053C1BE6|nr:PREDICTED: probable protein phosphatase 2C 68 [Tarenaya hassleriana]
MFSWLKKRADSLVKPLRIYIRTKRGDLGDDVIAGDNSGTGESFIWYKDLERHCFGDLSFAVVRGNEVIEDNSQVEVGEDAVFVGVYDGHGGTQASRFVADHLFNHFIRISGGNSGASEDILRSAFAATEEAFLTRVGIGKQVDPLIAAAGSCCLVGLISGGMLYIANLGDSRAVIGSQVRFNKIVAEQLNEEHNARFEKVRQELRAQNPDDSQIVVLSNGVWRVKGICQVSRAIGDAFLKHEEFSLNGYSNPKYYIPERLRRPALSAEPSITTRVLRPNDKFVIFASDGLWEYLTNKQAVKIVHKYPRDGIARRLAKTALNLAAKRNEMTYERLRRVEGQYKRALHDDISVVVLFIDHDLLQRPDPASQVSMKSFDNFIVPSGFCNLR